MHRRKREKNPIFSKQLTINFTGDALFWMHLHVRALSCRKHLRYSDNWSWDTGDLWVPLPFPAACQLRAPSECAQHGGKIPFQPQKASVLHKAEVAGGCAQPVAGHHICRIKGAKGLVQQTPISGDAPRWLCCLPLPLQAWALWFDFPAQHATGKLR